MKRRTIALILGVVVVLAAAACKEKHRPNVLLVTLDTTRADRIGAYGWALARTPNIDKLAAEGVLCSDAVASAPITMPSHTSIMTGLYPPAHGIRDNGAYVLSQKAVTLAERMRDAGFETRAFVSALVLNRRYGLDQGFDSYDDDLWAEDQPAMFLIRDRPARKTADHVLAWLDSWHSSEKRKPFFAWVHFFDPHQPYEPEPDFIGFTADPYDAEIATVDRALGRIFDSMRQKGLMDDTIVIVTGDHGESLGEHGEKTHAIFIYDATVRVPLIIRYPAAFKPIRYDGPVRHVDLVPTILGLLDLPGGDQTQGQNLTAAFEGGPAPNLPQYSESLLSEVGFGMAPLYGVRDGGFKWIRAPRPEVYDLGKDPKELSNRYGDERRVARQLDDTLTAILKDCEARAIRADANAMDKETEEMLMALGYLSKQSDRAAMGGMDPKDGLPLHEKLEDARQLARARRWTEAEKLLLEIVDKLPRNESAINVLGLVKVKEGDLEAGRQWYLRSLAIEPSQFRVYGMLASLDLMEQKFDSAVKNYNRALEISPGFAEAMVNIGFIHSLRGDEKSAEEWYAKAMKADPGFPLVQRRLGDLYYEKGDWAKALKYYVDANRLQPTDFKAKIQAGNAARRLGDRARADALFVEAAKIRPDSWVPAYNRACLSAIHGDKTAAIALLEESATKGLPNVEVIENDPDLQSLKGEKGMSALAAKVRANAAEREKRQKFHESLNAVVANDL